jgi:hypothetical protein
MTLWIPTGVAPFWVRTALDYATMYPRTQQLPSLLFIRSTLCLGARMDIVPWLSALPLAGLSSSLVSAQHPLPIHQEPFAQSESEFGFTGGVELLFRQQRLMVAMPIIYDHTFSLPHPLKSWSFGTVVGWIW